MKGGYAGKGFIIITQYHINWLVRLMRELGRGVTFISGQGYYSKKRFKGIYCIVGGRDRQNEGHDSQVDPQAFITITRPMKFLGGVAM